MFSFYKIPIIPPRQSVWAASPTTSQISSIQRPGKESIFHRAPHPFPGPMRGLPTSLLSRLHFCFICTHRPLMTIPAGHFCASPSLPINEIVCHALAWHSASACLQGTLPISCLVPYVYEARGACLPTHRVLREGLACRSYHCNNQLLWWCYYLAFAWVAHPAPSLSGRTPPTLTPLHTKDPPLVSCNWYSNILIADWLTTSRVSLTFQNENPFGSRTLPHTYLLSP